MWLEKLLVLEAASRIETILQVGIVEQRPCPADNGGVRNYVIQVDKMMTLRKQINEALASDGTKLSVNDFIVKASALVRLPGLKKLPATALAQRLCSLTGSRTLQFLSD